MQTQLPTQIDSIAQAKYFLTNLYNNGECFHPDDDTHDIIWKNGTPSYAEREQLNKLMEDISNLSGFDASEFILSLLIHV